LTLRAAVVSDARGTLMNDFFRLAGHTIENRYAVERAVAEGGFGVVYRATHRALGRAVALKVLKVPDTFSAAMKRAFVEQFQQEAQLISQLKHPGIVDVTDFGVVTFEGGLEAPWMALEWVDGATLADDLAGRRGRGGRSPAECFALFRPVLEALALAHARGVAHRDLKPGNLMLPALDAAHASAIGRASLASMPRMRVLDFGIAKVIEGGEGPGSGHTHTSSAMLAYSPRYASPEQQSQTRTGPWTDVHALGLLLTEVLVDAPPYVGEDKLQLSIQVLAQTRPTPGRFGVDVGAWEPVLAKAMALHPLERFTNAGELLDALEAQLPNARPGAGAARTVPVTGLAQKTPPPGSELHVGRPSTRRSGRGGWIAAAALVGVALVAAVAVGMSQGPDTPAGPSVGPPTPSGPAPQTPVAPPARTPPAQPEVSPVAPSVAPVAVDTPARVSPETDRERRARERAARAPVPAPPPTPPPAVAVDASLSPMERVSQCRRVGGDEPSRNNCIINALRNRASSDQELRVLAATYQTAGRTSEAVRTMRTYLQRYPQGSMASAFQRYIESHSGD